ncbi:MAG: tetratricopeptide repeat protein [Bacillota bacterium]
MELAVKYLSEGKFEEAVLAYNEVLKIDPKNLPAYKGLGKTYALQGKYDEAEKVYLKGLTVVEDKPQLKICLAGLYVDENKTEKAQKIYNELIKADPNYLPAYEGLMALYLSQGKTDQALGLLSRCVEINKDNERGYSLLAEAYLEAGNKEEALKAVVKSLDISLNQQAAYDLIGRIFKKDWEDVIAYGKGISKENERVGRMLQIHGSFMSERYYGVITLFEQIPSPGAQDYKAMVYAALAYLKTGKESEANRLINRIKLKQAKNAVLYADVARYYLAKGDKNKASEIALQGIEVDENCKENYIILMEIEKDNTAMVSYYGFMLVTRLPDPPVKALNYAVDHGLKLNNERLSKAYAGIVATSLMNSFLQIAKDVMNTNFASDEHIHSFLNQRYEAIMKPPILDIWKQWIAEGVLQSEYYAWVYSEVKDENIYNVIVRQISEDSITGYAMVENPNFQIYDDYSEPHDLTELIEENKIKNLSRQELEYIIWFEQEELGKVDYSKDYLAKAKSRYDFSLIKENDRWFFKELKGNLLETSIISMISSTGKKIDINKHLSRMRKKFTPQEIAERKRLAKELLFKYAPSWREAEKKGRHKFGEGYSTFNIVCEYESNTNCVYCWCYYDMEYPTEGHAATIGRYLVNPDTQVIIDTTLFERVY